MTALWLWASLGPLERTPRGSAYEEKKYCNVYNGWIKIVA